MFFHNSVDMALTIYGSKTDIRQFWHTAALFELCTSSAGSENINVYVQELSFFLVIFTRLAAYYFPQLCWNCQHNFQGWAFSVVFSICGR